MFTARRSTYAPINQPQPGEIWELSLDLTTVVEPPQLAERWCLARCVAIVREAQAADPAVCSAMLLSPETQYLSDTNILIPPSCSGLERDILAETWNVGNLSIDLLARRVGNRLSRSIYDLLLSIGDGDCGRSIDIPAVTSIRALGLDIAPDLRGDAPFQRRERILLQSLNPISIAKTTQLVELAAAIDRRSGYLVGIRTTLSQWFQQIVEPQWQDVRQFEGRMVVAQRSSITDDDITQTIALLKATDDEALRCQLIQRLGSLAEPSRWEIASGREDALGAMLKLIQTTEDDETLWTAVGSLRQLDPDYPSLEIGKLQSIDLGVKVNFLVRIVPKVNNRFSVLLQVYSTSTEQYLPPNLKLILKDDRGNSLTEVVSRSQDDGIQLKLSGVAGELFSVCLEFDGVRSIVDFVI
jgi:hypothetical protein